MLIAIFSIFFGPQFSLFAGLLVGYAYSAGYLKCLEISPSTVKAWEKRWPFSRYQDSGPGSSFQHTSSSLVNDPSGGQPERSPGFFSNFTGGGNSSNT